MERRQKFKGTCPISNDPPPPSLLEGRILFLINISLKPVLRLGVTIMKNCFIKKGYQGIMKIFYILSDFLLA